MPQRILIIDDNEDILETLMLILSLEGYDLLTALSPENILADIAEFKPDLIMLDIEMGSFDGLEVCKTLKDSAEFQKIPVIVFSSHERLELAIPKFGADAILKKPFEINDLVRLIGGFNQRSKDGSVESKPTVTEA